jgi:hypothetical protein
MLFYFLATGNTSWYTFVLLGFLVVERAIVALVQWVAKMMAMRVMESVLLRAMESQTAPMGDPTIGPIQGGSIEFPKDDDDNATPA